MNNPLLIDKPIRLPQAGNATAWGRLIGASGALAFAELAQILGSINKRPLLLLAEDPRHADQLEAELRFFSDNTVRVEHFVEWETLPWDSFSPHQDIISQRLQVLAGLPDMTSGVIIATVGILHQRLPPLDYVAARSLSLRCGEQLAREEFTSSLIEAGYLRVPQVSEHGEFAVRGSLIDIFPMGTSAPIRMDFFDDDIESLRYFSPEDQRSGEQVDAIRILPAREVPLDADAIAAFRHNYRERFEGQPGKSRVYREISDGIAHGGIEYYLPLFFESTASFADYVPANAVVLSPDSLDSLLEQFWAEAQERFAMCSLDKERPILHVEETFIAPARVSSRLDAFSRIRYSAQSLSGDARNFDTRLPPAMKIEARYEDAAAALTQFLQSFDGRVLFSTDSPGRREQLHDLLAGRDLVHGNSFYRDMTVMYLKETLDMIEALDGTVLTLVPSEVGKIVAMSDPDTEWQWAVEGIKELAAYAKSKGIMIGLEPLNRFETNFLNRHDQALKLAEDVGYDNVGVTLDAFHINIEEKDPFQAILNVGTKMVDFHVADNNRHPPGGGSYDWKRVVDTLKQAGYDGYLTSEFVVPFDRSPLREEAEAAGTEASEDELKFIRDHGSDLMSDAQYSIHVENTIKHLRACGA